MIIYRTTGDSQSYRVYVDQIGTATISNASAPGTVGSLTVGTIVVDNTTTPKSVVMPLSAGRHGDKDEIPITITLSTGGPLVRTVPVRTFDATT